MTNLPKWFDRSRHLKVQLAQFTWLSICTLDPLLQARLVDIAQSAGTSTRWN